jgi:hypothetical protein
VTLRKALAKSRGVRGRGSWKCWQRRSYIIQESYATLN